MPTIDIRNCQLVWVKWIDTHTKDGWVDVTQAVAWALAAKLICESCGWLLEETDDRIVLASHRDVECMTVDNIWVIPKVAILEWCDILEESTDVE